jgi:hypothetical protein
MSPVPPMTTIFMIVSFVLDQCISAPSHVSLLAALSTTVAFVARPLPVPRLSHREEIESIGRRYRQYQSPMVVCFDLLHAFTVGNSQINS